MLHPVFPQHIRWPIAPPNTAQTPDVNGELPTEVATLTWESLTTKCPKCPQCFECPGFFVALALNRSQRYCSAKQVLDHSSASKNDRGAWSVPGHWMPSKSFNSAHNRRPQCPPFRRRLESWCAHCKSFLAKARSKQLFLDTFEKHKTCGKFVVKVKSSGRWSLDARESSQAVQEG